uniref:Uncharacterized protein n=1 Tax=Aegilops tauschii subsp. strangulata TaxID=200361 RepID=A0A453RHE3_AEGTS
RSQLLRLCRRLDLVTLLLCLSDAELVLVRREKAEYSPVPRQPAIWDGFRSLSPLGPGNLFIPNHNPPPFMSSDCATGAYVG